MKVKIFFTLTIIIMTVLPASAGIDKDSVSLTKQYEQYVEYSYDYLGKNQPDSAQLYLEQALLIMPKAPTNYLLRANLSQIHLAKGDTAQAIALLSQAISERPDEPILHEQRGGLYALTGRLNEALIDYDIILKSHPDRETALYNRALIRSSLGLDEGAEADLQHIVHLDPKAYLPRLAMADIYIKRGQEDQAEKLYNYLINTFPNAPEAYRARARLYVSQDRKALAMKDVRAIITQKKKVTYEDYLLRGLIWLMYGEKKEANADFKVALNLGATEQQVKAIRQSWHD